MKKFFVFVVLVATASNSYAYYSDYSYSSYGSSSVWSSVIQIIMFVGGILEIILFFKIWGMTNNVKKLKMDHFSELLPKTEYEMRAYLRENLMLGKIEKVKQALIMNFIDNVTTNYKNNSQSIRPYVENLQKQFDKIGEELPVYISRMNTFGDYYQLFTKKDFVIEKESKD